MKNIFFLALLLTLSSLYSSRVTGAPFAIEQAELCLELADWFDHPLDELEVCEETKEYSIVGSVTNDEGVELSKVFFSAKLHDEGEILEVYFHITKKGEVYYMYE